MHMKKGRSLLKTLSRSLCTLHHHKPSIPKMDPSERYCYNPILRWNPEVEEYFVKGYGADHFARISKALTRPSCYSCIRVNTLKSTRDAVMKKLSAILQERGWRNDPAEGANNADDITTVPVDSAGLPDASVRNCFIFKCTIPSLDHLVFVRGSGPHTIDYGYKEDKPPKEVIVSRKCAEAVLRGAHVYVPGVLACSAHVEKGEQVAVSVAVEQPGADGGWGVGFTRGTVLQGSQTDPYYFERNGLYIGQGTTMMSRTGMFRASEGVALDMDERVYNLPSFHNLLEGEIFLQNLPSIITAHALDPQEGEKILDMCAAPGGKTTAIAILMKDKGEVIAADRSHNKVLDIQKLAAEMGLKCITTYKLDALRSVQKINKTETEGAPHPSQHGENESLIISDSSTSGTEGIPDTALGGSGTHDVENGRLLLSAVGTLNLRTMHCNFLKLYYVETLTNCFWETVESLRTHAKYQRRMFDQAVQLVRPGGVLVYSTCTINPGENEALVRYALDTYKFLSLASQHPRVGGPGLVGVCQFSDGYQEEWLRPGEEDLVQRFDPSSSLDTIGFFIAKFNVGSKDI
ncbi:tRNA and rRNA cytosine-C5-methylase (nucleolar protein NOL1/NOP2) [Handroanthus impetiginosus]|uniref:tRNA and rRNA cytosine-C5-methylase (Nucleolar protein NOL1/NOP2) n=1 Tax=Handroanthus impetiginosus TaxID=429701 RepID=A0A2G9H2H9_9LAMI|nr:tRNA and rRNA cytosine-C5-methylase (nucleolar protein NOL1/NOP2) [Handroanthus impetiginosus]